jgi:hypothetical protein
LFFCRRGLCARGGFVLLVDPDGRDVDVLCCS